MSILGSLFKKGEDSPSLSDADKESDQSEEDIRLAAHIRSKIDEVRASANRVAHEGIWMTNIAYTLGYDGLVYNTSLKQFEPINRSSAFIRKNRIHINKILPTLQNRLARLAQSPPKWDIRPETNDSEDKEAARLGMQLLGVLWDKLSMDEKRIALYMWVQECGHAYIKTAWDPSAGKWMVDPMTNEGDFEGEVSCQIVSPFEVFPDPMAKTLDECQWIIHAKVRKLDYFKTRYPSKGELVKQEPTWLLSLQYDQRINSLNARGPSQGGMTDIMEGCATELIKYERPSKKYPQGRQIACASGILLENKELPIGDIPFAKFDDILIGGKYYSESTVTHLRPIQDQYNELLRRRSEWTKKLLSGKMIVPRGADLADESLNDEQGEVAYYTPVPGAMNGGQPMPLQMPTIPQYAYAEESTLDGIINYISGISDVSRGQLPSASIPALGMQILVDQDQSRIGVMTTQHEHAWAKTAGHMLKFVEKYYIMPRKIKVAGKALQYAVHDVSGKDLRGNTDVIVKPGSTIPTNKVIKRQDILNAYGLGLLGDPKDPKVRERVLSEMEFGDIQDVWADQAIDQAQIRRGIEQMRLGSPVVTHEFDNHPLWIEELNKYRKGESFATLPQPIQTLFDNCSEQHVQWLVQIAGGPPPPNIAGTMPHPAAGMPGQLPPGMAHMMKPTGGLPAGTAGNITQPGTGLTAGEGPPQKVR